MDFHLPPALRLLYAAPPPAEQDIDLTEKALGRILPDEFKSLARLANGGQPEPNWLTVGGQSLKVDFFLALGEVPPASEPAEKILAQAAARQLLEVLKAPREPRRGRSACQPGLCGGGQPNQASFGPRRLPPGQDAPGFSPAVEAQDAITILEVWRDIKSRLPQYLIPIAAEAGGGYFCYDFRRRPPGIVFWEPYRSPCSALPVADSLEAFLKLLSEAPAAGLNAP